MTFARPEALWLVTLWPILAAWVIRGRRLRARDWSSLGQSGRPRRDGSWAWLVALLLLALALAQPRWGRMHGRERPVERDIAIAIDVSRSMAAEDAVPSRLAAAVDSAGRLIEEIGRSGGDRVAVIAFAGRGVVRCPLTENLGAAVAALKSLAPGDVRPGGTDLGAAIATAIHAFDNEPISEGRSIILFSDGEDHVGTWRPALHRLRSLNVIVHGVALGDAEKGATVPTRTRQPLRHDGRIVISRRRDEPMRALAEATGGAFIPLGLKSADLGALYRERIEPIARHRRERASVPERAERFGLFVIAAMLVGLLGSWPRPWRAFGVLLIPVVVAGAGSADDLVARGWAAYEARSFDAALGAFERAIAQAPEAAVPRYDAAATLFQLGRFEESEVRYREARSRADMGLKTKIDFALGNVTLARGDIPDAVLHYDSCLSSPARGAAFESVRRAAAINRAYAIARSRREDDPGESGASRPDPSRADPNDGESNPNTPASSSPGDRTDVAGQAKADRPSSAVPTPSGARPPTGTPSQRLDAAMESIRQGHRRRLVDELRPLTTDDDTKDW